MKEDGRLKLFLVLQSFFGLFLLMFIKYVGHLGLMCRFFVQLLSCDLRVFYRAFSNPAIYDVIVSMFCFLWFILTGFVAFCFDDIQKSGFSSYGECIVNVTEKKDSGVTFLVTFILPLLVDDLTTWRDLLFFFVLLFMTIFLLSSSDLFYQNPVLVALGYKVFEFSFVNPNKDVSEKRVYIGITRGDLPVEGKEIIKRKYISDNVFLIYKDFYNECLGG